MNDKPINDQSITEKLRREQRLTVEEAKRLAPAAQNEFRFLLKYLITALDELTRLSKQPGEPLDPATLRRLTTNVQDAYLNVDTLRSFTKQVCDLLDQAQSEPRGPSLQAAYVSGWNAHLRDLLQQLPGEEYAEMRRLIEQIARDEGYTPPPKT